ncbi:hypothetical protein AVEN_50921-1 [Araneus ventricosus]|uniref:Uncharacterized protein n=1 Tax=Araneus ventricosus TaxID=182803 RepID=A0A4Y2SMN3_ARAVE|nr:hypothetical protein AVEN_50921-1 [Araneus ventricosus]
MEEDIQDVERKIEEVKGDSGFSKLPADKLTDLKTIEKALESRYGDGHLTQFCRIELKTRRQKTAKNLQVLAADMERLKSLVYAEFPLYVQESLAVSLFVDAIRDEDTQLSMRLMDLTDLKAVLAYSMKYEAAETVPIICMHAMSIKTEDNTGKKND